MLHFVIGKCSVYISCEKIVLIKFDSVLHTCAELFLTTLANWPSDRFLFTDFVVYFIDLSLGESKLACKILNFPDRLLI